MPKLTDTGNGVPLNADTFTHAKPENYTDDGVNALTATADCPARWGSVGERRRAAASIAARARWAARGTIADVLRAGVDRSAGPEACWPWTGDQSGDGYGRFTCRYRPYQAHKVALELKLGRRLARGEVTRHGAQCGGSRLCCNPDHLQPGTVADNNRDTLEAGRVPTGERVGTHRLTAVQVEEIRREAVFGQYEAIGRRYGVTGKTISNIARGLKWKAARAAAESVSR